MPSSSYASRSGGPVVRPHTPVLPRQPDFSAGRCSSPGVNPDWWTSGDQGERQAAIFMCQSCPLREPCAEWSLSLPSTAAGIFGGMTASARIRARRERAAAASCQPGTPLALAGGIAWPSSASDHARTVVGGSCLVKEAGVDEQTEEVVRPRRRGEPRPPAPEPQPEPEPMPAGAVEAQEQPPALPEPQPVQAPPKPQAAQPAQAAAVVMRVCSFCQARMPLADLDQVAPMMLQCRDAEVCAQRAAGSGMYAMDERELEMGLAIFETGQGALR